MLIKCPECNIDVSDRASSCPCCGYPLKENNKAKKQHRMRLPNGFGQISKIENRNLRKPYRAMLTVGKQSDGHYIVAPLKPNSYFSTYNEAYAALIEYHKNPYDLSPSISVKELYDKWTDEYFKTLKSKSSERTITCAWAYCSELYDMRASDLRARHIKGVMENGKALIKGKLQESSPGTKARIKSLFNLMLDYALEYEIVDKNYARTFDVSKDIIRDKDDVKRGHIPFTDSEMEILWNNVDNKKYVDILLIQCYSGWRPQELGLIEIANVDLDNWTFKGGIKTEAGIDRIVPIHPKIRGLVCAKYDEAVSINSKYLFNCTDSKTHRNNSTLTYDKYQYRFAKIISELKLNDQHRAHDGRKHFITMAKKYKVDEYAIKYIVGHSINDITEKVYTQREISWLKEEIEKIK